MTRCPSASCTGGLDALVAPYPLALRRLSMSTISRWLVPGGARQSKTDDRQEPCELPSFLELPPRGMDNKQIVSSKEGHMLIFCMATSILTLKHVPACMGWNVACGSTVNRPPCFQRIDGHA